MRTEGAHWEYANDGRLDYGFAWARIRNRLKLTAPAGDWRRRLGQSCAIIVEFSPLPETEKRKLPLEKGVQTRLDGISSHKPRWKRDGEVTVLRQNKFRGRAMLLSAIGVLVLNSGACRRGSRSQEENKISAVSVIAESASPVVTRLPGAEYDIWPSGYVQAYQIQKRTSRRLSIEQQETGAASWGDKLWVDGKEVNDFVYDFKSLKEYDVRSKIGKLGKRVEVKARSNSKQIEKTLALEVFDDFPNMAVEQLTYLNLGTADIRLDRIQAQRHRLDASIVVVSGQRNAFWSFHGASMEADRDAVFPIPIGFSQRNVMASPVAVKGELGSVGGGVPVVALWTATLGLAIGHVEPLSQAVAFPVHTFPDGVVETYMEVEPGARLKSHEQYSTPRSFVATYTGDYFEPLSLYAQVMSRQGSPPAKPGSAAYGAEWVARADDAGAAPAQIAARIPELKAMNVRWVTLAGKWFGAPGDWQPRGETFSAEAIQELVSGLHRQGILVGLSWTPLAVEDAEAGRKSGGARVAKDHPEWLVLDKSGHHARTGHNLAALCPAVPEVQEYIKQVVVRFIQTWGFDGLRLEDVYTVPECHNPAHHHQSPQDSQRAIAEVHKQILLTVRSLRPEGAVTISPDGTPPNFACLPYVNKVETGGPTGSPQVRHGIKMYKALLGPAAAVSANAIGGTGSREDLGGEFASTVGLGAVASARFNRSAGADDAGYKKWLKIYNDLMLSQGEFQNLYVTGFDDPEGYVIQQHEKTYFAFFASQPDKPWKGELELRGLKRGRFRVFDYANGKELGTVTSPRLRIAVQFTGYLLLEVSPQQ